MIREIIEFTAIVFSLFSGGYLLSSFYSGKSEVRFRSIVVLSLSLFSLIPLSIPKFRGDGELVKFAEFLNTRDLSKAAVYSFRCYPQALVPYLHRTIGVVGFSEELEFGIKQLAPDLRVRRFPNMSQFRKRWQSNETLLVITEKNKLRFWKSAGLSPGRIIKSGQTYVILANHRIDDSNVRNNTFSGRNWIHSGRCGSGLKRQKAIGGIYETRFSR